jgi:tripartite ATP-independent transporter DctM subunit
MSGASPIGLWMLPAAAALVFAGLPAWIALLAVSCAFTLPALALGAPWAHFTALPARLTGLLENDLLQALPLFVLMGCVLNQVAVARAVVRSAQAGLRRAGAQRAAAPLAALAVSALLAPVNGSVGASVAMLWRTVNPALLQQGAAPAARAALIAACSTLGVVIPPSLVLVLLGDAMMSAHTQALNATGAATQIVNTQAVLHAALLPAALLVLLFAAWIAWQARRGQAGATSVPHGDVPASERITAVICVMFIGGLLTGVAAGMFYAVEAAATAAVAALSYGLLSRQLTPNALRTVLHDALGLSGALFALLVAATTFSLVFRSFGTDRWLEQAMAQAALPPAALTALVLLALMVCALALDAFEIVFVAVPIFMPPLLMQVSDAAWVAVLTLLVLQLSFLLPPLGFALLLVRGLMRRDEGDAAPAHEVLKALAPFIALQLLVLLLVFAFPRLTHPFAAPQAGASTQRPMSEDDVIRALRDAEPGR